MPPSDNTNNNPPPPSSPTSVHQQPTDAVEQPQQRKSVGAKMASAITQPVQKMGKMGSSVASAINKPVQKVGSTVVSAASSAASATNKSVQRVGSTVASAATSAACATNKSVHMVACATNKSVHMVASATNKSVHKVGSTAAWAASSAASVASSAACAVTKPVQKVGSMGSQMLQNSARALTGGLSSREFKKEDDESVEKSVQSQDSSSRKGRFGSFFKGGSAKDVSQNSDDFSLTGSDGGGGLPEDSSSPRRKNKHRRHSKKKLFPQLDEHTQETFFAESDSEDEKEEDLEARQQRKLEALENKSGLQSSELRDKMFRRSSWYTASAPWEEEGGKPAEYDEEKGSPRRSKSAAAVLQVSPVPVSEKLLKVQQRKEQRLARAQVQSEEEKEGTHESEDDTDEEQGDEQDETSLVPPTQSVSKPQLEAHESSENSWCNLDTSEVDMDNNEDLIQCVPSVPITSETKQRIIRHKNSQEAVRSSLLTVNTGVLESDSGDTERDAEDDLLFT